MELTGKIINGKYKIVGRFSGDLLSSYWNALDISLNNIISLQFLKNKNIDYRAEDLIRFKKTIELISEIEHPAIIKVFEAETFEEYTYIATEELADITLSEYIENKSHCSINLTIRIILEICSALQAAHEKELSHGDLNPEKIWLKFKSDGIEHIKLHGFGIKEIKDLTRINSTEDIIKTFSYMSPEASGIINKTIDERSDLYSLGIIFYQLLTGELPFKSDNIDSILHRHIALSPAPPSGINSDIPEILDKIILKLLSKDQEDRYQSARGLSADLKKLKKGERNFETGSEDRKLRITFNTGLVGRDRELSILKNHFDNAYNSSGSICFISAPDGRGKTRLVDEIRGYVYDRGGVFLAGKCIEHYNKDNRIPYQVFTEALDGFIDHFKKLNYHTRFKAKERLRAFVGEFSKIILKLNPSMASILDSGSADKNGGLNEKQNFLDVYSDFICSLGKKNSPVLLFLDNLHLADEGSLTLLSELARKIQNTSILIICAFKNYEVPPEHSINRLKQNYPEIEEIRLGLFDLPLLTEFVTRILGEKEKNIPPDLPEYIFAKSRGNPLFAVEIIKQLVDSGVIFQGTSRWEVNLRALNEVRAPSSIVEILLRGIKQIRPEDAEVLACASVIGLKASMDVLQEITGMDNVAILNIIDNAAEHHLIDRKPSDKGYFTFVHDKIRDAFYSMLPGEKKRSAHQKIAELIETSNKSDEAVFSLVHHYSRAGNDDKSLQYAVEAGNISRERYANEEASGFYRTALDLLEKKGLKGGEQWFELQKRLSRLNLTIGNYDEAIEIFNDMMPLMKSRIEKARIYRQISSAYYKKGDLDNSEQYGIKGLRLLGERIPQKRPAVIAGIIRELFFHFLHSMLPGIFVRKKENPKSEKHKLIIRFYNTLNWSYILSDMYKFIKSILRSLNIAESKIGKSRELGGCLGAYASLCMSIPLFKRAVKYHNRALRIREGLKADWGVAQSLQWMGYCFEWMGEFRKSIDYFTRSSLIFQKIGDAKEFGMCIHGLVQNYYFLSDVGSSMSENQNYSKIASKSRDKFEMTFSWILYALCYIITGDYKDAEYFALRAYDYSRDNKIWLSNCTSNIVLGMLFYETGEAEKALDCLHKSEKIYEKQKLLKQYTVFLYPVIAMVYISDYELQLRSLEISEKTILKKIKHYCRKSLKETKNWPSHYGITLIACAKYYALKGKTNKAKKFFYRGLRHNGRIGVRYWLAKNYYEYGLFLKDIGDIEAAKSNWHKAFSVYTEIGSRTYLEKISFLLGISDFRDTYKDKFIDRRRLSSVIAVSQQLSSILNIEELLDNIVSKAIEVTGAMRGYLFITEEETQNLKLAASKNIEQSEELHDDFHYSSEIINDVYEGHRAVITHNALEDKNLEHYTDLHSKNLKSILCIPIMLREKCMGVFYLDNRLSRSVFSEADVELLNVYFSQAAISIENAGLYQNLEKKVEERTKELRDTQQKLVDAAHQAGMVETATSVLHNVGNVLNSINISSEEIINTIKDSRLRGLLRANIMLKENLDRITDFISSDPKGSLLPQYYIKVGEELEREHNKIHDEISRLRLSIQMIKDAIETHRDYTKTEFMTEDINLYNIIEDALKVYKNEFLLKGISVKKEYPETTALYISGQKTKLIHIFLNLFKNASDSMSGIPPEDKLITIVIIKSREDITIKISDSGGGILKENLKKIFNYGFTTKPKGQGFGLHTCANFMTEMGGRIYAESEGSGTGATFTMIFPGP